jgi:hypothetical protein|tara:strand:- start:320 stop:526 length:207 start_codon:yes stop_codon:yes gene_type:complete
MLKDKRGFLDTEVLFSPAFVILFLFAFSATMMGFIWAKRADWVVMPIWQLLVIIVGEFIAAYFFAAKG